MKKILFIGVMFFCLALFAEIPDNYFLTLNLPSIEIANLEENEEPVYIPEVFYESHAVAPERRSNGSGVVKKHETQGLANIDGKYWIISKNNWIDIFKVNSTLFSDSEKVYSIDKSSLGDDNKFGDIDFFNGRLYVPNKGKIEVYEWNPFEEKLGEKLYTYTLDSFGTAIHPKSRHLFYNALSTGDYVYGQKLLNDDSELRPKSFDSDLNSRKMVLVQQKLSQGNKKSDFSG
jgi:hypothetical protein